MIRWSDEHQKWWDKGSADGLSGSSYGEPPQEFGGVYGAGYVYGRNEAIAAMEQENVSGV